MDTFSHYVGTSDDLIQFLAVPALPGELYGQQVNIYEIPMEADLLLKVIHTPSDGGDEDVRVEVSFKDRQVFSLSLSCVRIVVDKPENGNAFLVLYEGSTNLYLYKNPWSLSVSNSTYYSDTGSDSDVGNYP